MLRQNNKGSAQILIVNNNTINPNIFNNKEINIKLKIIIEL